jgi:hypothetical protein
VVRLPVDASPLPESHRGSGTPLVLAEKGTNI